MEVPSFCLCLGTFGSEKNPQQQTDAFFRDTMCKTFHKKTFKWEWTHGSSIQIKYVICLLIFGKLVHVS